MFVRQFADTITMTASGKPYLSTVLAAGLLLAASLPVQADETTTLLCDFEHGQLEFVINYTRGTANDATAIISDKEIIWSPGGDRGGMAVINRYTGIMQLSRGNKEFYGRCNKKPE
jgi:hypothetical protein